MSFYQGFAHALMLQSPLFVVLIVVLVVSVVRWRRHPKASALALAGTIVLLVETAASAAVYTWLPLSDSFQTMSPTESERFYDIIGLADNFVHAVGVGLCCFAIFVGRRRFDGGGFPMEAIPMVSPLSPPPPSAWPPQL